MYDNWKDLENSINTPEGIAHFLEHKLFENEDGTDASTLFAKTGADVNAFTTANQTAYLFSATNSSSKSGEPIITSASCSLLSSPVSS